MSDVSFELAPSARPWIFAFHQPEPLSPTPKMPPPQHLFIGLSPIHPFSLTRLSPHYSRKGTLRSNAKFTAYKMGRHAVRFRPSLARREGWESIHEGYYVVYLCTPRPRCGRCCFGVAELVCYNLGKSRSRLGSCCVLSSASTFPAVSMDTIHGGERLGTGHRVLPVLNVTQRP